MSEKMIPSNSDLLSDYEKTQNQKAKLERLEKDIKHLERSKAIKAHRLFNPYVMVKNVLSWLLFWPFRVGTLKRLEAENLKLLYLLEKEVARASSYEKLLNQLEMSNEKAIQDLVQYYRKYGQQSDVLKPLINEKQRASKQLKDFADYMLRTYEHVGNQSVKDELVDLTVALYQPTRYPEFLIRMIEQGCYHTPQLDSFSQSLFQRFRLHQEGVILPDYVLDDKRVGYQFIDHFPIKRPEYNPAIYQANDIPLAPATVIKPTTSDGGRGVYLIFEDNKILNVKKGTYLDSLDLVRSSMALDLTSGQVQRDAWYIEPLYLGEKDMPCHDLKFYCFYGEIGLVLETKRTPEVRYCWWTADGESIDTGKYNENLFKGHGFTKDMLEQVKTLSLEIPAPFMRIDFLNTREGLVFGEFTKRPGNFDQFSDTIDQMLGKQFVQAEARLMKDIQRGKAFEAYHDLTIDK